MLQLRKGSKVPFPEQLQEGYEIRNNMITANISADKIEMVMAHFICMRNEPVFFILELPVRQDEETESSPGVVEVFHKDVYYIDGCSRDEALTILSRVGQMMIDDGLCAFGFGGHESQEEIVFGKYNITTLFSRSADSFREFFKEHDIPEVSNLKTAWDTFSHDHPGSSEKIITDGKDVYSIPVDFEKWGIYKAERRED